MTYGNKSVTPNELKSGDAFDCDVNGDGEYNSNTERFYYVSDYYNTSTKEFETDTAVLIYYNNVENGIPDNNSMITYDSTSGIGGLTQNYHGPINAKKALENLLKEVDIDIIHGHYLFPAGAASVEVGKKHGIKTYITAHGSDMFEMYKKQFFMRPIIKKVLKKADLIRENRKKNFIYYELNLTVLEELMMWLSDLKNKEN